MTRVLGLLLLFAASSTTPANAEDADPWSTRTASPAVVHPAAISPLQKVLSLRGEWDFVTDPQLMGRHRMGKGPGWNEPDWSNVRHIQVPGCWEAQGVGEPGMSRDWGLPFDCIPRPLNHVYMGTARYRRTVEIPADWAGQRIWLKVGGVRTEGWFWVNQQRVAHLNTYCGSYKYDITDLVKAGGKSEIVATVRNDTPSRKGCMAVFHRFGGLYRDVELEATPATRIDDVWVRSDLDKKTALVNVSIRRADGSIPPHPSLGVVLRTLDGQPAGGVRQPLTLDANGNADVVCEVPLSLFRPWTPETPHLYLAEVTLFSAETAIHGWTERFGVRKLEVRGNRFYLNGVPFFVRGYGDDYIYPLTLTSPPDRQQHLEHLLKARKAGFNYVRHHTHCEIPEFFEAADEAGILIQPELPYYHDITPEGFPFDPLRDIKELYRHYRRYVSFATYSTGNEGHLGSPLDREIYQWAKRTDPDRIFQHQDGGCNKKDNSDFITPNGYGLATSIIPWAPGTFDALDVPFLAHEYLNLGIKLDPRLAPKFTGAIPAPRSLQDYEASLSAVGLDRSWGDACLDAAHSLQGYYQKCGLEQARLDPACDGYSYWTIVDVMVPQGGTYTGQGFLNAFWQQKQGGLSLDQFRKFNGPTTILMRSDPASPIAVAGQTVRIAWSLSHFGAAPLKGAKLAWRLCEGDHVLASGSLDNLNAAIGDVREIGSAAMTIPELSRPVHARLEANLAGLGVDNQWDFWLFPKHAAKSGKGLALSDDLYKTLATRYPGVARLGTPEGNAATAVITASCDADALAALKAGRRVLILEPAPAETERVARLVEHRQPDGHGHAPPSGLWRLPPCRPHLAPLVPNDQDRAVVAPERQVPRRRAADGGRRPRRLLRLRLASPCRPGTPLARLRP